MSQVSSGGPFARLAPRGVIVVETSRPSAWEHEPLHETEAPILPQRATAGRGRDVRLGRACARRALARLGAPAESVPGGPDRQPLWPPGVVGSITHCDGYAAAAVARQAEVAGLGIDVERNMALQSGVVRRVCTPAEQGWLATAPQAELSWPVLIFSAKESIYKAWFPLTGRWLGFLDVTLQIDPATRSVSADVMGEFRAQGWFTAAAGHVFTMVMLEPATLVPKSRRTTAMTTDTVITSVDQLKQLVGQELRVGDWFEVTQEQIDAFAEVTGDHQWIHVDVERAKNGPFGGTIAHGLYTLSISPRLFRNAHGPKLSLPTKMGINYGYNRIRFPSPVRVGTRIRGHSKLVSVEEVQPNVIQQVQEITVEVEGQAKPAMVAEQVSRMYL